MSWNDFQFLKPEKTPEIDESLNVEIDLGNPEKTITNLMEMAVNLVDKSEDKDLGHLTSRATKALVRPFVEYLIDTNDGHAAGLPIMAMCKAFVLMLSVALIGAARPGHEIEAAKTCGNGMKQDLLDLMKLSVVKHIRH